MISKLITLILAMLILPGVLLPRVFVSGMDARTRSDIAALAENIYPNQFNRIWILGSDFDRAANDACPNGHSENLCFYVTGRILMIREGTVKTAFDINSVMAKFAGVSSDRGERFLVSLMTMTVPRAVDIIWVDSVLQHCERVFIVARDGTVRILGNLNATLTLAEIPPHDLRDITELWHSHPNGDPRPSDNDANTSKRLRVPVYVVTRDRIGVVYPNGTVKIAGRSEVLAPLNKY